MNIRPRARVIIDNDFSGDPDDLFQLVHHVWSPSVQISFVIGSHLSPDDVLDGSEVQADNAARVATEWLDLLGVADAVDVYAGSNVALRADGAPIDNAAVRAIIREALREDVDLPLFYAAGAGMTELASALLIEPSIAEKLTLIWIGGREYPEIAAHPDPKSYVEYNHAIDPLAACVVFNDFDIPVWQVPRDSYAQCGISAAEIDGRVRTSGSIGRLLAESIDRVHAAAGVAGSNFGETYVLGDSPLVLLTALTTPYSPDTFSSDYVDTPRPTLNLDGTYSAATRAGNIRVYTRLDTRLMFEDLFLKLAQNAS